MWWAVSKKGDDQCGYEEDENSEESFIRTEGKDKGNGKKSDRAPKSSIELWILDIYL